MKLTEYMIEKLDSISPMTFVLLIAMCIIIVNWMFDQQENINNVLNSLYNRRKTKEYWLQLLNETSTEGKDTRKLVEGLCTDMNKLAERLDSMEDVQRANRRTDLKKDISTIYKTHHESQQITEIEKEMLEELIRNYENAGGANSFVHTVVEKEMYLWDVV